MRKTDRIGTLLLVLATAALLSGCITFLPSVKAEYCCGATASLPESQRAVVGLADLQAAIADTTHPVSKVWIDRKEDRDALGTKSKLSPNAEAMTGTVVVLAPGEYVVVVESALNTRTVEVVDTAGRKTTLTMPSRLEAPLSATGGGYYTVRSDGETVTVASAGGVSDIVGPRRRIKY